MSRRYFLTGAVMTAATIAVTLLFYSSLPPRIPIYWNLHGEVNRYAAKWTLPVLAPGMMVAVMGLFALLPWLSPRNFGVDSFRSTYLYIMLVVLGLLAYTQALLVWTAEGFQVRMDRAAMGGIWLMFVLFGRVLPKVKRNFYVGIRTPWTLANEGICDATHRFAARTFVSGGVVGLLLAFGGAPFGFILAVLLAAGVSPVAFSLIYYKRLGRRGML